MSTVLNCDPEAVRENITSANQIDLSNMITEWTLLIQRMKQLQEGDTTHNVKREMQQSIDKLQGYIEFAKNRLR